MAWGIFNKIKKGFKKIGSVFKKGINFVNDKKGINFVNDKIIKPFKPIIKTAANAFIPGAGSVIEAASDGLDAINKGDSSWGDAAAGVGSWAKKRFG